MAQLRTPGAALVVVAATLRAAHAGALPEGNAARGAWVAETTERGVRLSLTSAEPLVSRDPGSLKPVTVRPALRVECADGKQVTLLATALQLPGSSLGETQRLRVRFDAEPPVDWLAAGLAERGKLVPTTLVLEGRGGELVRQLLSHDHLLVRFASRAGFEETAFELGGLDQALGPLAARCGLTEGFVREASAARASRKPAAERAGEPGPSEADAAPRRSGKWLLRKERSALDGTDTVTAALPSEQAIAHPRTPRALLLLVRSMARKLEVFATGVALPADTEHTVLRFDDEPPRTLATSASVDGRALFFPNPGELLKALVRHRRMVLEFRMMGLDKADDIVFDLEGLDGIVDPVLESAGLARSLLAEPPRPGKWILDVTPSPQGPPQRVRLQLFADAESPPHPKPGLLVLKCEGGSVSAYLAAESWLEGTAEVQLDGEGARKHKTQAAGLGWRGERLGAALFPNAPELVRETLGHQLMRVRFGGKTPQEFRFDVSSLDAWLGPLRESCPIR